MSRGGGGVRESNETTRYLRKGAEPTLCFFCRNCRRKPVLPPALSRSASLPPFLVRSPPSQAPLRIARRGAEARGFEPRKGPRVAGKITGENSFGFSQALAGCSPAAENSPSQKELRASGPPDPLALAAPARLQHRREVALARSGAFDWRSRGRSAGIGQRERSRFPISTFRRADGDGKSRQRERGRGSKPSHPSSATPQKPRF